MGTESDGKDGKVTADSGPANVSSDTSPAQTQDVAAGGGGVGTANPDDKKEDAEEKDKGDPVNVVKGTVVERALDFSLPGLIPFEWRRRYSSGDRAKRTPLGRGGWTHDYHQWIEPEGEGWSLRNSEGADLSFPAIPKDGAALHRGRSLLLRRQGQRLELLDLQSRNTLVYEPHAPGGHAWLRSIADGYGNRVTLQYEDRALSRIVDTAGREIVLVKDGEQRIVAVDVVIASPVTPGKPAAPSKTHRLATYAYTAEGELASAADALGRAIRYEYDGEHRIVKKQLRNGFSVRYEYDPTHGRVVRTRGDGGYHNVEFIYDFDKRTTTTHSEPQPRVYHWDAKDDIVREESFDGRLTIERTYDDDHLLLSEKNAAGEEHQFEHDARGFLIKYTDPAGNVTVREHVDDLLRRTVWPNGSVSSYEYDGYGGLWSITYDTGARHTVDRDGRGRITAIYGPNGVIERRAWDEQHRLVRLSTALGHATSYEYDDLGRPVRRTGPLGQVTSVGYDDAGQPISMVRPDGTTLRMEYDGVGRLTRVQKPGGDLAFDYIATGVLSHAVMEDGSEWHIDYDRETKPVRVKNPKGETYEFTYDRAGNVVEERTFDGRRLRYHHDLGGRVQRVDHPDGSYRAFAYDPLGHIVEETSPHGPITFARDPEGRILEARLEEGPVVSTVTFERDALGRVIAETQDGQTITFTRDIENQITSRTLPNGEVTRYHYDLEGQLVGVEHDGHVVSLSRDAVGQERSRHLKGSPTAVASTYDSHGRLLTQEAVAPTPEGAAAVAALLKRSWKYDPAGRPARIEDARWGATDYFHDKRDNLVRAQRGSLDEAFEYDPAGCIVRAFTGLSQAGERWGARAGDVLLRTDKALYEVDEGHRRTKKIEISDGKPTGKVTEYVWDCRDRLREVRLPGGETVRYFYDAFGRRTRKVVFPPKAAPGAEAPLPRVVRFLWEGNVLAAELSSETGTRTFVHERGTFRPLLQAEQGEVFLYVLDQVGAPRELLDAQGRVAWAAAYKAWGQIAETRADPAARRAQPVTSPFRLLGQYADEETGLHCTRFRYWDPEVGRWCSPDPIGLSGGARLFSFDGTPTMDVDPWGLDNEKAKSGKKVEEKEEIIFRAMSEKHFKRLQKDGRMPATGETTTSPTRSFSESYDGVLVEFRMKPGTLAALEAIGVHDGTALVTGQYPNMPPTGPRWAENNARFKGEKGQINIALGRGRALDIFNDNIVGFTPLSTK